jgi:hypothetical protein
MFLDSMLAPKAELDFSFFCAGSHTRQKRRVWEEGGGEALRKGETRVLGERWRGGRAEEREGAGGAQEYISEGGGRRCARVHIRGRGQEVRKSTYQREGRESQEADLRRVSGMGEWDGCLGCVMMTSSAAALHTVLPSGEMEVCNTREV